MTKREIKRAAYVLQLWAVALRQGNTIRNGDWDETAGALKNEHDEMLDLSKKLYALAREPKQLPL